MRATVAIVSAVLVAGASSAPGANAARTDAREVEIVGVDYAFRLPATLPPGRTTFRLSNEGQHRHEFNVVLLKRGVTIDQVIKAGNEGKPLAEYIDAPVGVLFAGKGKKSAATLTTNLLPGRVYGIECVLRDTVDAPRHVALGMYGTIQIGDGRTQQTAVAADSVIAVDYAYSNYPRGISPGMHSLAFRNAGKQRHEMSIVLLKAGVTVDSVIAYDKRGQDVRPLFDQQRGLGVLHSRGGETALGTLDIDFLAGREYLISCSFQDDPKSPPHFVLGMDASIRVNPQ